MALWINLQKNWNSCYIQERLQKSNHKCLFLLFLIYNELWGASFHDHRESALLFTCAWPGLGCYGKLRILMTYWIVSWCIWIVILIQKIRFVKNQTYLVSNWTISDPKEFSFLKINLHWEIEISRTFLEIWFLTENTFSWIFAFFEV